MAVEQDNEINMDESRNASYGEMMFSVYVKMELKRFGGMDV